MKVYYKGFEVTEKTIKKVPPRCFLEIAELHQEHPKDKNLAKLVNLAGKELSK